MKLRTRNKNKDPSRRTRAGCSPRGARGGRDQGSFLIMTVLFLTFVLTLVLSTMGVVNSRVTDVRVERNKLVAINAAESGIQRQIADIRMVRDLASLQLPYGGIDSMDPNSVSGAGGYTQTYGAQTLTDRYGNSIAEYDVLVDQGDTTNPMSRTLSLTCIAYVPSKAAFMSGLTDAVRSDAHVMLTVPQGPANVFDYAYFINHWGWFYGNNIHSNGSVRSNGQFDFGGYQSQINGSPRYESSNGTQLIGYQDDNQDGLLDGTDGGVYAGMAIVGEQNVKGMGALAKNQHEYEEKLEMPNLSDLSYYESKATAKSSSISIGGTPVVSSVLGDGVGEQKNLYLVGTAANPIVLNGPVVVRGSVIISGYVTGQGSIFAKGNIYIPKDLKYLNPPTTWRPASNDQATTEAWRAANQTKDALGLYSAEHMVIGNYENSTWRSNVNSWITHPLNKSVEDAGADGIHNTRNGLDGVYGTADDDVIEGDGVWTVSRFTSADQAAGRIPAGKSVGDVIPGTGEDIDGDGAYDPATTLSNFTLPDSLTSSKWAGNVPAGTPSFSSISGTTFTRIDGVLYTNHTLPALMIAPAGQDITFNGSIVSRNESIIYSARYLVMNHDERLSGSGGEVFGMQPPNVWKPMTLSNWEYDRKLPIGTSGDPAALLTYFTGIP